MNFVFHGADVPDSAYPKTGSAFLPMLRSPLPTNLLSMCASPISPSATRLPCSPSHQHLHLNVAPCSHLSQGHHLSVVSGSTWSVSPRPGACAVTCPRLSMGSHMIRMDRVRVRCLTGTSNHCQRRSREDSASYSACRTLPCAVQFCELLVEP